MDHSYASSDPAAAAGCRIPKVRPNRYYPPLPARPPYTAWPKALIQTQVGINVKTTKTQMTQRRIFLSLCLCSFNKNSRFNASIFIETYRLPTSALTIYRYKKNQPQRHKVL